MMTSLQHGFHSALRLSRRNPGYVGLIVVILGLGIGATTAALSVASSVLFSPLPVADESRLVLITKTLSAGSTLMPFSYAEIAAWREASRTLESVAGVQYDGAWPWPAQYRDHALTVTGATVTGDFFATLGAQPVFGRLLTAEDAKVGAADVAVLGYGLWRRQFGGDPTIVGQRMRLNGRAATIVGVAPSGLAFPKGTEVWQPLIAAPEVLQDGWFTLLARLRPTATLAQASDEASALLTQLRSVAPPHSPQNARTRVVSLKDAVIGDVRSVMTLFVAAATLLLFVCCINVVILLLVRGTERAREISVCAALGATPGTLIGQLVVETTLWVVVGGGLGAFATYWLQRSLVAVAPAGVTRLDTIHFNERTLTWVGGTALLTMLIAGVVPAFWTVRSALFRRLRGTGADGSLSPRAQVGRQVLVAVQLAFALLVTVAGALLVRTLQQLQTVDLGFASANLSVAQVPLVAPAYSDPERRLQLFDALVVRVQAAPGIAAATPVLLRPFTGTDGWDATFAREGQRADEAAANPGLHLEAVATNYFSTLGVSIIRGRWFNESDRKGALPVAIVGESLARHAWADASPLGKRLKFGGADSPAPWMTVVGVVRDLRYRDIKAPPPAIYVPLRQSPFPPRFLILRAKTEHVPTLAITQQALKQIDATEPVTEAATIDELLATQLAGPEFHMFALGLFALIAVLLAGVGVFGVLGAFVAERTREVGLRIALGANRTHVRRLVLSKIGWPVVLGLIVGTSAAFATMPFLHPLLFRVSAFDGSSFIAGWIVLLVITVVASLVPLRRAVRIDPIVLLRSE
jgi:predicted permease